MKTQTTYLVDRGYGLTYRGKSVEAAKADKAAIGVHVYEDGQLVRSIYWKR